MTNNLTIYRRLLYFFTGLILIGCTFNFESGSKFNDKEERLKTELSNWIKKYALYPDSYESVSFSGFTHMIQIIDGDTLFDTEKYKIQHVHKLLDRDSIMTTFEGFFVLNYDFSVNMIETERNLSIGGAYPPEINEWIDKHGRDLTSVDSVELLKFKPNLIDFEIKRAIDSISK